MRGNDILIVCTLLRKVMMYGRMIKVQNKNNTKADYIIDHSLIKMMDKNKMVEYTTHALVSE